MGKTFIAKLALLSVTLFFGNAVSSQQKDTVNAALFKKLKLSFDQESNLTRRTAIYEALAKLFPPQRKEEKEVFDDDLTWELMEALADSGYYAEVAKYESRMYNVDELAGVYNEIAGNLIRDINEPGKDLKQGKEYLKKAELLVETYKDAGETYSRRYASIAHNKARLLYKEGEYAKAYEEEKKFLKDPESLAIYAEKAAGPEEAKAWLEKYIKTGFFTSAMNKQLKRLYLQNHNESSWSDYFGSLTKELLHKRRTELLNAKLNQPSPPFELFDLNGQMLRSEDLKGKIVVLDFWATWCVPCIKRFPGMQTTIEKFRNDQEVVFLFVNTFERVPPTDRVKLVEAFFRKNKYQFRVLLDDQSKRYELSRKLQVSAIPTKVVIDKKGNIIFKETSGYLDSDLFSEELSMMIEIAKGLN